MIDKALSFITKPGFASVFAAFASDPAPGKSWNKLYENIFIRFLLIFVVVYQNTNDFRKSIYITVLTISFFFTIATKKEKKEVLSNNFRKQDFKNFSYFCIYLYLLYKFGLI